MEKFLRRLKKLLKRFLSPSGKTTADVLNGFQAVGSGVVLEGRFRTTYKNRINLGSYVFIGDNSFFHGRGTISIGDYSIISSEVLILSSQHHYKDAGMLPYDQIELISPVVIGNCCWIGIRAIILPGVQLGEGCIVGAGAVVTKSFEAGSILAGNPAVCIGHRDMQAYKELVASGRYYMLLKQQENLTKIEQEVPPRPLADS